MRKHTLERHVVLCLAVVCAGAIQRLSAQESPQVSLDELKQRFQADHIKLTQDLPAFGRGQFAGASMQLEKENFVLRQEVMALARDKEKLAVQKDFLAKRLAAERAREAFLEKEREWFYGHALGRMKRVEHYQRIFKNPILDEAIVLYAGAPLCVRPDFLTVPSGSLLVNFSFPVPTMRDAEQDGQGVVLKFARLLAKPLRHPQQVAFAVLRRSDGGDVNREIYRIMDTAEAGIEKKLMEDEKLGVVLYEWELPTVLRAKAGDFLALVLAEEVDLACDLTGQARMGILPLEKGKVQKGQEFLYQAFEISRRSNVYSLDESATFSMGFYGWTSSE